MKTAADARSVLADLADKASVTAREIAELDNRRAELSFDAHASADPAAKKALAKVNADRAGRVLELEEIEHARKEARQRIYAAQALEDEEAQRRRAELAAPIAARLAARGKKLDEAIQAYVEHFAGVQSDLTELNQLGVPAAGGELVRVNMQLQHDAATASLGGSSRQVPAAHRRSFATLLEGWSRLSLTWISGKLEKAAA